MKDQLIKAGWVDGWSLEGGHVWKHKNHKAWLSTADAHKLLLERGVDDEGMMK